MSSFKSTRKKQQFELQKKCSELCVTMSQYELYFHESPFLIFQQSENAFHNFLDISEYFHSQPQQLQDTLECSASQPPSQQDSEFQFQLFRPAEESNERMNTGIDLSQSEEIKTKPEKRAPKSIASKNVCFNICQKTIKIIQKNEYPEIIKNLCQEFEVERKQFVEYVTKDKKFFTGPKALQMFVERKNAFTEIFRQFMIWFLKEKYIRHCLKGEMDNKEVYIKYKNQTIMAILL